MADADEDIVQSRTTASQDLDQDSDADSSSPLTFLNALYATQTAHPSLPRRGEKAYEPLPLPSQITHLRSALSTWYSTLSYPRIHMPNSRLYGYFNVCTGLTYVPQPHGVAFRTMGHSDHRHRGLMLWPEEALYLLERGSLEVWWINDSENENEVECEAHACKDNKFPVLKLSVQSAYAAMIGRRRCSLERYIVYSSLRRSGYVVTRAPEGWEDDAMQGNSNCKEQNNGDRTTTMFKKLWNWVWGSERRRLEDAKLGPLVKVGLYRNYGEIYRLLSLFPQTKDPDMPLPTANNSVVDYDLFQVTYNLYTTTQTFRKTAPGPPSFRICVLPMINDEDCGATPLLPTCTQFLGLLATTPKDPPSEKIYHPYARIKHGVRNVLIATVDNGVVSYLRLADADFENNKMYERRGPARKGAGGSAGGRGAKGRGKKRGGKK